MSWEMVKLGEIAETSSGGTPNRSIKEYWVDGNIPWIKSGQLKDCVIEGAEEFITDEGLKNSSAKFFSKGTLMLALYGATAGKLGFLGFDATTNQAICSIVPKSNKLNIKFLYYYLLSKRNEIINDSTGGAQPNISQSYVQQIQIPLPPLSVQKRIAEILDAADALRRKDHELLKKYDELAQAIFIDMFGDPVKNEKGVSLTSLIKINPTKSEVRIEDNTDVTFVPMNNVGEDGVFNNTESRKYLEVKSGFTYFREGDVLFAKITPCMENGKGAIARDLKNGIGFGSTEFHVLRPNEKLNSQFIFHLTKLSNFRVFAEANMTGSAGQKRVPSDFFGKIKIDVSKLEKQNAFAKAIDILVLQKKTITKEKIYSENLFQTLLQQAFKGELVAE